MSRRDISIRNAVAKWKASGARELGLPEPGAYMTEGRVADSLYLGPDDKSGWAIVNHGRIERSFTDRAYAWEVYRRDYAGSSAKRK